MKGLGVHTNNDMYERHFRAQKRNMFLSVRVNVTSDELSEIIQCGLPSATVTIFKQIENNLKAIDLTKFSKSRNAIREFLVSLNLKWWTTCM